MFWFPRLPIWATVAAWVVVATMLPAGYGRLRGVRDTSARLIHDEHCYLLQADTFARGRMTNSTPRHPEFFESPYLFLEPSYQAKYPPAQALFMAIGQKCLGHPVWGVWLSCGVFAGALYWMLSAWTNRRWAALGTVNAVTVLGINHSWSQLYWGGMVAAAGGALVIGGTRWTLRRHTPSVQDGLLTGLGTAILANARPYEGIVVCLPCAPLLAYWLLRGSTQDRLKKIRVWFAPFVAVLVAGIIAMGLYNQAVTGNWKTLPYVLHPKQYFTCGIFRWQPIDRVPERHPANRTRLMYEELPLLNPGKPGGPQTGAMSAIHAFVETSRTLPRFVVMGWTALPGLLRYVLVSLFLAINAWTLWTSKHRGTLLGARALILAGLVAGAGVWWNMPHYNAPFVCLCYFLAVDCLRRVFLLVRTVWRSSPIGARQWIAVLGLIMIMLFFAKSFGRPVAVMRRKSESASRLSLETMSRSQMLNFLERQSRPALVFVSYDADVSIGCEWVYNSADLESQRVVLAHDLDRENNQRLVADFPDRDVWYARVRKPKDELHIESGTLHRGDAGEPSKAESH